MSKEEQIKAVCLLSGGLDSTLAVRIMLDMGVEVAALHFRTGFSYEERDRALGDGPPAMSEAEQAAAMLGVKLEIIDISDEFLPIVLNPRYGYGSGMNPCVDCRIALLRRAKLWMETHGGHFIVTGEVVGQRPKSQMPPTLRTVERESGLKGYLLRPLSAKLLPPTIPELRGWVDREKLCAIDGRGRKAQIALAQRFGITHYPQPYGGCCYLIDQTYARRMKDFLAHEGAAALTREQVQLLAVGRHLRLPSGGRVVVGRHEQENNYLEKCGVAGVLLTTVDHPGPVTLALGAPGPEEIELAARITAGYSDGQGEPDVRVEVRLPERTVGLLTVAPFPRETMRTWMI